MRVQIDGAQSALSVDATGEFAGPTVTVRDRREHFMGRGSRRACRVSAACVRPSSSMRGRAGLRRRSAGMRPGLPAPLPVTLANRYRDVWTLAIRAGHRSSVRGDGIGRALCRSVRAGHGDGACPIRPFGLALAVLDGAHWSALSPTAPLRRWRLIALCGDSDCNEPASASTSVFYTN